MITRFHKITAWFIITAMLITTTSAFAETSDSASAVQPAYTENISINPAGESEENTEPGSGDETETLPEDNPSDEPEAPTEVQTPQGFTASNSVKGILLSWLEVPEAQGYYIFRKQTNANDWSKIATITASDMMVYEDKTAAAGKKYYYSIQAYYGEIISEYSESQLIMRVPTTTIKSWKRISATSMVMTWNRASVSGYQIQYSPDNKFNTAASFTVTSPATLTKQLNGLKANTKYYLRIRTYINEGSTKHYSEWVDYNGLQSNRTFTPTVLKKKKKTFELRTQAKQKLYQYDVLQGSCTDGKYGYYILLHKKKANRCKVVKVKLSNMKVTKVSKSLKLYHGNDMTYNSKTKKLIVVHAINNSKQLSVINPHTLKLERRINIAIPAAIKGATYKQCKAIKGFSGIAYNSVRNQYIMYLKGSHDFLILDANFRPVSYCVPTVKNNTTYQGIDASTDYVLLAQSPKSGTGQVYNLISVYDWDGEFLFNITVNNRYEIESIYHIGNTYYAGFYRSYYKTAYKYKKKKVKVKWKKVKGKWKYKYKKKKVKVKYKKYNRADYIYKIGTIK